MECWGRGLYGNGLSRRRGFPPSSHTAQCSNEPTEAMGARASGDLGRTGASCCREGAPDRSASFDSGRPRPLCTATFAPDAVDNRHAGRRVARSPGGRFLDAGRTAGARRRARGPAGRLSLVEVRPRVGSGDHPADVALVRAVEGVAVSGFSGAAPTGLGADRTGASPVRDVGRLRLSGVSALCVLVLLASPSRAAGQGTEVPAAANPSNLVAEGYRLLDSGRGREAEAHFRSLLVNDPENLLAHEGLVSVYEKLGDPDKAAREADVRLRLAPRDVAWRERRIWIVHEVPARREEAISAARAMADELPRDLRARV